MQQALEQRSHELDQRAHERDQAITLIAQQAAQIQAHKIALDRREILESALDSELGKFAARVSG